jgi:glycosyltransferase involved in cell wall biosynthesis
VPNPLTVQERARAMSRRVVYVSRFPPPGGGISVWTQILFRRGLPGGFAPELVDTRLPPGRREVDRSRLSAAELLRTMRILAALVWTLLFRRPTLVHVNLAPLDAGVYRDLLGVVLARTLRVPVVLHHHGLVSRFDESPGLAGRRLALVAAARLATMNLAVNEPSAAFLRRRAPRRPVRVLPNFIDETESSGSPPPQRGVGEKPRAVYAGALTRAKGVPRLLAAAEALPDVEFQLFGAIADEMRPMLAAAPPNVTAHGELDRERLAVALGGSHVFVCASEHEGFPLSVAEAMGRGLPVVATPVGALPEMIEDGRGGRLCAGDPASLARAVAEVLADESRRLDMGRFNQERAHRLYAYPVVARRLASAYEEICGARGQPRE